MSYPTRRDLMEKAADAAIARLLEALGNGVSRRVAIPVARDHILKAADRYAHGETTARRNLSDTMKAVR